MSNIDRLVTPDPQKGRKSTSKKLKAIDQKTLIDPETGEMIEVGHVKIEQGDANFEKIWLGHVLEAIDEIGTKKISVLMYLFKNRNAENLVVKTNKQIAEELELSYATVASTLSTLVKHDIIKRGVGHIVINPNVVFRGAYKKRMNVLLSYSKVGEEAPKPDPNTRMSGIVREIIRLMTQLRSIEGGDPELVNELLKEALKH